MKIEITDIKDSVNKNSSAKILLAEQIISEFAPLFSEEIERKKKQLNDNLADIAKLRASILKTKDDLKTILALIKKENVKNEILNTIEYLNSYGVLYGKNKQVIREMLSSIGNQSTDMMTKNLVVLKRLVDNNVNKLLK